VPDRADRLLTIPNVISVVRLCCLPLFLYLLFGRDNRAAAAWLLAALGTTDWIDGYIARHFDQVSELGKILDPVADRLLFFVGVGGIMIDGSCPLWFGKAGTFGLMVAFPLFLASHSTLGWADTAEVLAWIAGIPGLVFGYISLVMYVPLGIEALRAGRADRAARVGSAM